MNDPKYLESAWHNLVMPSPLLQTHHSSDSLASEGWFASKLPHVGTTIFTTMSALAAEYQAINLGQGFPDFPCDPALLDAVNHAMHLGHNQYAPMPGIAELRQALAQKIATLYGHHYDPHSEITVTAGATQAIFTAIAACVGPNDEVIVIEPAFDSYLPAIQLAGGKAIPIAMEIVRDGDGLVDSYALPWAALANAITPKTRLILTNTPHNPTASIWSAADLERLYSLVKDTSILILSDEVYEHMVFDGKPHESIARHAALAERSFLVSSFGKTFHVTGWKLAFIAAPAALMHEYRKVHQFNVFSVNTPMQYGIAHYLQNPKHYLGLPAFYQAKRDYFRAGLASTPLKLLPCAGSYFQCVDYTALPRKEASLSEAEFCRWLTTELGVAAIPNSAFYANQTESGVIRFCFAKQESTLKTALHRLQALAS